MKASKLLPFLALFALLHSCKDEEFGDLTKPTLNVSDAQALTILEESSGGRTKADQPVLFKITSEGTIEVVKFVNKGGVEVNKSEAEIHFIERMMDLNRDYFLLSGFFVIGDSKRKLQSYTALLVRKSDGAVFDFGDDNISRNLSQFGDPVIKHDAQGNIYYVTTDADVYKLSLDNPDEIVKESYLPSGQKAWVSFAIDADGNCIYQYDDVRVKKISGGLAELRVEGETTRGYWIGSNGHIYLLTSAPDGLKKIHKISIINNEVLTENVWSANHVDLVNHAGEAMTYQVKAQNSVIFVSNEYAWEFFEDDNSVIRFASPPLGTQAMVAGGSHFYYIATGTNLFKVDVVTHEYTALIRSGEYEVYAMNVLDDDVLQFNGLRFRDGKKVFGEINSVQLKRG